MRRSAVAETTCWAFGVTRVGLSEYAEGTPDAYELLVGPFYQFQIHKLLHLEKIFICLMKSCHKFSLGTITDK